MNAQQNHMNTNRPASGRGYLNAILTANVLVLGVIALNGMGVGFSSVSLAQPAAGEDTGTLISAAEQRKQMIVELKSVSQRLEKIEATLARGVNVNVKNFPANFGKDGDGAESEKSDSGRKPAEIKRVERPAPATGNLQPK